MNGQRSRRNMVKAILYLTVGTVVSFVWAFNLGLILLKGTTFVICNNEIVNDLWTVFVVLLHSIFLLLMIGLCNYSAGYLVKRFKRFIRRRV